jgi:alkylation response protein AidB-like acyl-CoA dehydrogenase
MDLRLSEEQEILKKSAREFLADKCPKKLVKELEKDDKGYSPQMWQEIAALGWTGLVFPEHYGGGGMTFLDLSILLEEMGRACFLGPFFSTVILGGLPILDLGTDELKEKYLPDITAGKKIFTLALTEPEGSQYEASNIKVKAVASGSSYVINGTKLFVPFANVADYLLCVARTKNSSDAENGVTIFIVDAKAPGITTTVLQTIARDKLCEVVFKDVRVSGEDILGKLDNGWADVQKIIERSALAKCCEMVGGMQAALEMTLEYVKKRVQFDALIGSFQAIQHHCVNMLVDVEASRVLTYEAAWKLSHGLPYSNEADMAKAWASDAYSRVVATGTQAHGGVSIIEDHDMPLYFRRAKAAELVFGDGKFHRRNIAKALGFEIK